MTVGLPVLCVDGHPCWRGSGCPSLNVNEGCLSLLGVVQSQRVLPLLAG